MIWRGAREVKLAQTFTPISSGRIPIPRTPAAIQRAPMANIGDTTIFAASLIDIYSNGVRWDDRLGIISKGINLVSSAADPKVPNTQGGR